MKYLLTLFFSLALLITVKAQMHDGYMDGGMHGGWTNNDTLVTISVSGTAIVDSSMMNSMFYIDEDGDGVADYQLSFGPYWYQPDSSSAVRPSNGDAVTLVGGLEHYNNNYMNTNSIVVYEINGQFWRDPMIPTWNDMGGHSHMGGHHGNNCNGYSYGFDDDRIVVDTTLDGIVYVDTTYFMDEYYLDTDNDQAPDFMLNFGPPWYIPVSGAVKPNDGDAISIKGRIMSSNMFPMIVVYELNGVEWRDSSSSNDQFGGSWFHKDMTSPEKICSPFDNEDWMKVNPGWNTWGGMGGMGGMMMYDSLFGQMLEVFPQNIPFADNENLFAGYEIGVFTPNGNNGMWENGSMWDNDGCGGMMNFGSNINYQLHYNDIQVQGYGIEENSIQVKYWSDQTNSWEQINNAVLDKTNNTINFPLSSASNFIILTADQSQVTEVKENTNTIVNNFTLEQNFPNPFNPSTKITFTLNNSSNVKLNIYNAVGQLITTLVNSNLEAGSHSVKFDATSLSSGTYFYQLEAKGISLVKRMVLLK